MKPLLIVLVCLIAPFAHGSNLQKYVGTYNFVSGSSETCPDTINVTAQVIENLSPPYMGFKVGSVFSFGVPENPNSGDPTPQRGDVFSVSYGPQIENPTSLTCVESADFSRGKFMSVSKNCKETQYNFDCTYSRVE